MKTKSRNRKPRSVTETVLLTTKELNSRLHVVELEKRCLMLEKSYNDLREHLVNLLSPDQKDAAKTCGIAPELYALEWINICSDALRKYGPSIASGVINIRELS